MKLSEEQKRLVKDKLNEFKNDRSACDICGTNDWQVLDNIWVIMEVPDTSITGNSSIKAIPLVAVMCAKCGHIHFLNSLKLGIDPLQDSKPLENPENTRIDADSNEKE